MMTRSTDECEISRSCQSGTFSKAACALERTTRASPLICSQVTGLRLCGIAEELFGFSYFSSLKVANLGGELVERAGDDRERRQVVGVAVALNHLRRDGSGLQSQALAHLFFEFGAEMGESSNCAGKLSDSHFFSGAIKALDVAAHLRIPVSELESEGDGLSVNAVGASDHGRVFELPGAALENIVQLAEILRDDRGGLADE